MLPALAALLVFVATAVYTALALVLPGHRGIDPVLALVALLTGSVAGGAAFFHARRRPENRLSAPWRPSVWAWVVLGAFALFACNAFCWLVYPNGTNLMIGSPNNLGDISLHMQLANNFAQGAHWWPDNPEAAGYALRYYPGVDLFQGLWQAIGTDELPTLTWVSLAGSAAAALALYRWGGSFTVAGFLFSGGLAGFQFFEHAHLADYQTHLAWKSLPLAIFVTQRPFLYALPAGLLLLIHWREKLFSGPTPEESKGLMGIAAGHEEPVPVNPGLLPFWVEVLLYATLPLFHLFAFVFLSALLGWWLLAYWSTRPALRAHLLSLIACALGPATAAVALMTGNFSPGGVPTVRLKPGWMAAELSGLAFWKFWLVNFGLFALFAPALWLRCWWTHLQRSVLGPVLTVAPSREEDTAAAFVLPAGVLFLVACVVMFAPWDWDNTKLMLWCYVAMLPFLWARWVRPLVAPVRWTACALLFFSGAVCVAGAAFERPAGYQLTSRTELDGVRTAVDALPIEARFAAAPDYNHPLVYCGRKIVMGYAGHLPSEGIDPANLEADLKRLMNGEPNWRDVAQKVNARYLFWGRSEAERYPQSSKPWESACAVVATGDWGAVFDLTQPGLPVAVPAGNPSP